MNMGKHEPTEEMIAARRVLDTTLDLIKYHRLLETAEPDVCHDCLGPSEYVKISISAHIDVQKRPRRAPHRLSVIGEGEK